MFVHGLHVRAVRACMCMHCICIPGMTCGQLSPQCYMWQRNKQWCPPPADPRPARCHPAAALMHAMCMSVHMYWCVCVCMHACVCVCMHACIHACMYIHMYMYIYIHTYTYMGAIRDVYISIYLRRFIEPCLLCIHKCRCMHTCVDVCIDAFANIYRLLRKAALSATCHRDRCYMRLYAPIYASIRPIMPESRTGARLTPIPAVCMYACMYVCMYAWMYVCVYVCVHACIHACMHVPHERTYILRVRVVSNGACPCVHLRVCARACVHVRECVCACGPLGESVCKTLNPKP